MTPEPFRPEELTENDVLDADNRLVGRVAATHYEDEDRVGSVEIRLDDGVRSERLLDEELLRVEAGDLRLENGRPRLTMSLEDLLEKEGVSHASGDNHPSGVPDHKPHVQSARAEREFSKGHEEAGGTR